jgi:hypothetical protein
LQNLAKVAVNIDDYEHKDRVASWYVPIFANPKSQFGYIWEGLEIENVGIFYGYFDYYTAIFIFYARLFMLWPLCIFYTFLVYCSQKKSGNPALGTSICV